MVVAGFQGVDEAGTITTLGRGGSDTTGVALAAALEGNTSLRRLDLASNEIGAEGGTRLAKLLELSTALSRLDLRSNDLRACIGAFQAALEVRGAEAELRI